MSEEQGSQQSSAEQGTAGVEVTAQSGGGRGWRTLAAAALAFTLYLLLIDTAVETGLARSPVRWWVVGVIGGYLLLSVLWWWKARGLWRRVAWPAKSSLSFFVLLGLVAGTAWMSEGLTNGIRLVHQSTSMVFFIVTTAAVALGGSLLAHSKFLPMSLRTALALLAAYGVASFGWGIYTGTPYLAVLGGEGFWKALPWWLQGATVGALGIVPLALAVQLTSTVARFRETVPRSSIALTLAFALCLLVPLAASN